MTLVLNGTTGVSAVDGSASTPAIQGNDTNTGMFFPAADTVAVATGGTERVRVDSSGNLLVGTTSASYSATNRGVVNISGSSGGLLSLISGSNKSYLFQSGVDLLIENDTASGAMIFGTNASTERMRIDSSGNLLVASTGTWDPNNGTQDGFAARATGQVDISRNNSACMYARRRTSNGTVIGFYRDTTYAGEISVTNSPSTAYTSASDYRLKENVQPMQNALTVVAQLRPVTYTWKSNGSTGQGFIAHELQEVCPDAVTGEKDAVDAEGKPVYQGIDTSFLVATLTAAIQELNAKVESLTAEIATLKGAQA